MRISRVRFTLVGMMVAVAAVALLCYGVVLRARSIELLEQANIYRAREGYYRALAETDAANAKDAARAIDELKRIVSRRKSRWEASGSVGPPIDIRVSRELRFIEKSGENARRREVGDLRIADHYALLRRKYEHAARFPFLPVAPDPPPPPAD